LLLIHSEILISSYKPSYSILTEGILKHFTQMEPGKKYFFHENFYIASIEDKDKILYGIGIDPDRKEYFDKDEQGNPKHF